MLRTLTLNYYACILVLASLTGVVHGDDISSNKTGKEAMTTSDEKLSESLENIDCFLQEHQKSIPVDQRPIIMETIQGLSQKSLDQINLSSEQTIQKCYDCSVYLSSNDLGPGRLAQCQKIIAGCLPYLDVVSTRLAINVVGQMSACYDLQGQPLTTSSVRTYRNIYLRQHLRVWERVAALPIDPTWHPNDPSNMVANSMSPPGGKYQYLPGVSPENIEEPEIRKQYEAMLEANRKKAERNVEQANLRQLKEDYLRSLKRTIATAYEIKPVSGEDLETLKAYLRIYVSDEKIRKELFETARSAAKGK